MRLFLFLLGSVTSSDSGHSTQLDSHSNSSVEAAAIGSGTSPPHRRHSVMQPPGKCHHNFKYEKRCLNELCKLLVMYSCGVFDFCGL